MLKLFLSWLCCSTDAYYSYNFGIQLIFFHITQIVLSWFLLLKLFCHNFVTRLFCHDFATELNYIRIFQSADLYHYLWLFFWFSHLNDFCHSTDFLNDFFTQLMLVMILSLKNFLKWFCHWIFFSHFVSQPILVKNFITKLNAAMLLSLNLFLLWICHSSNFIMIMSINFLFFMILLLNWLLILFDY